MSETVEDGGGQQLATAMQQHERSSSSTTGGAAAAAATAAELPRPTELSDTNPADWVPPRKLKQSDTSAEGKGSAGKATQAEGGKGAASEQVVSNGIIYAVPASNGLPIKYYYKMQNVKLTRQALYFYHDYGTVWE